MTGVARRLAAVIGSAVAIAAAAGCGIGTDEAPRALPVPSTTTTTVPEGPTGNSPTVLYEVQQSSLVPIVRQLTQRTPRAVMESLLVPPTERDGEAISSLIPAGTELLGTEVQGELVVVDLSEEFNLVGDGRNLAQGQIVLSLTALESVSEVGFEVEGEPIPVTSPNRGDVDRVGACDFRQLLADPENAEVDALQRVALDRRRTELRDTCPAE